MRQNEVLLEITTELTVNVVVAGRALGIGRNAAYREAKSGRIPTIKMGRQLRVPTAKLRNMLGFEAASPSADT